MAERERERDGDLWKRERKTKRGEAWLPRASLGASAERLSAPCHLSRPSLPLVWTPGVWMDPALPRPPRLHHSTCAVLLSPRLVPMQGRSPHSSLFYRDFVCPHPVCHTFRFGEWGQQETLDGNGFRYPKAKVVFQLCRFSSGTRGCKCNHIFKGWLLLLVLSQHRGPICI
jgi:hypothetical protein